MVITSQTLQKLTSIPYGILWIGEKLVESERASQVQSIETAPPSAKQVLLIKPKVPISPFLWEINDGNYRT